MEDTVKQLFESIQQRADDRFAQLNDTLRRLDESINRLRQSSERDRAEIQHVKTGLAVMDSKIRDFEKDLNGALAGFRREIRAQGEAVEREIASRSWLWKAVVVGATGLGGLLAFLWRMFH